MRAYFAAPNDDKVERTGNFFVEISTELREHDRRLVRLEVMFEGHQTQRAVELK